MATLKKSKYALRRAEKSTIWRVSNPTGPEEELEGIEDMLIHFLDVGFDSPLKYKSEVELGLLGNTYVKVRAVVLHPCGIQIVKTVWLCESMV